MPDPLDEACPEGKEEPHEESGTYALVESHNVAEALQSSSHPESEVLEDRVSVLGRVRTRIPRNPRGVPPPEKTLLPRARSRIETPLVAARVPVRREIWERMPGERVFHREVHHVSGSVGAVPVRDHLFGIERGVWSVDRVEVGGPPRPEADPIRLRLIRANLIPSCRSGGVLFSRFPYRLEPVDLSRVPGAGCRRV